MPKRTERFCAHPGCRNRVASGYCPEHQPKREDWNRENASRRGYDARWRAARREFLASHPWCAECLKAGRHVPATDVDHVIPHRGDRAVFWDEKNWQPLCHSCHSKKTASGR